MEILVTGGAGFVGSHLAERLGRDGHDVVVPDDFDPFYDPNLKERNVEAGREAATDGSYTLVEAAVIEGKGRPPGVDEDDLGRVVAALEEGLRA